jgi:hypothetical protein
LGIIRYVFSAELFYCRNPRIECISSFPFLIKLKVFDCLIIYINIYICHIIILMVFRCILSAFWTWFYLFFKIYTLKILLKSHLWIFGIITIVFTLLKIDYCGILLIYFNLHFNKKTLRLMLKWYEIWIFPRWVFI